MNRSIISKFCVSLLLLTHASMIFGEGRNNKTKEPVIIPIPDLMAKKAALLDQIESIDENDKSLPNIVLIFVDDLGYADIGVTVQKLFQPPILMPWPSGESVLQMPM